MTAPDRAIRVLVVDDDAFVRSALSTILSGHDGVSVVATAADGSEVPDLVTRHRPDVVLMDIRMPGVDGLTATELHCARPDPPEVVVLTTFDTDEYVMRAVESVAGGDAMLSPTVTRRLLTHVSDPAGSERRTRARDGLAKLSDREREVAFAVGKGMSNARISAELFLSLATVKTHVSSLLQKLDVGNRVEVALIVRDAEEG